MDAFDDMADEEKRLLRLRMEEEWETTFGNCGSMSAAKAEAVFLSRLLIGMVLWLLFVGMGFRTFD